MALLFHRYVYGPTPPATLKFIDPVIPAEQELSMCVSLKITGVAGCVKLTVRALVQLYKSVTTTV